MNTCPGVKSNGEVCGKRVRGEGPRCATHMRVIETNGPHTTARNELTHRHRAAYKRVETEGRIAIDQQRGDNIDNRETERMIQDLNFRLNAIKLEQRREMQLLIRQQQDEVIRTGVNPDQAARDRRAEDRRIRLARAQILWDQRLNLGRIAAAQEIQNRAVMRVNEIMNQGQVNANQNVGELQRFAADAQNVHTTTAVQQTKDMVDRILKIPVSNEYRWNMNTCSKTPGEIILLCNLSPRSGWQMMAKYCQDEEIYELGKGIYGKVLDGVWQYILKSPDKDDLCRVLKQEMEDNIGMCAQGNLTRLCNILAGYMEGIGVQESPAEVLGRKLPMLLEIDDQNERLNAAFDLLTELRIPENQWISWVEPLVDAGGVRFKANGAGQVIGFEVVA